jgi:hypothetical protein
MEDFFAEMNWETVFMLTHSMTKIVLAAAFVAVSLVPTLAAPRHHKTTAAPATGACAHPSGRCVSDCDSLNWCTMYTCTNGKSTPIPVWRCFQPSGLCLAPHC